MSKSDKFNKCSFRGVPFAVFSDSTTRGQKVAVHEYPNSDVRGTEALGKIPPTFSMTCVIHGDDFFERRGTFEEALEKPGRGDLVHPVYGRISVQPGEYKVDSSLEEVGQYVYDVTFYVTAGEVVPKAVQADGLTVSEKAAVVRDELNNALTESYIEPSTPDELDSSSSSILDTLDAIQDSIDEFVGPIQDQLAEAQDAISRFRNGVFRIAQTATDLQSSVEDMYNSVLQLSLDVSSLSLIWEGLLEWNLSPDGTTTSIGEINTFTRLNNATNLSLISEHTRLTALTGFIESSANADFNTIDEITNANSIIEDHFSRFVEKSESELPLIAKNPNVRSALYDLRTNAKTAISQNSKNAWRVENTKIHTTSMALLSYNLYESISAVEQLSNLNPSVNSSGFSGDLKIITR